MRIFSNIEVIKNQFGELLTIDENDTNRQVEQGVGGRPIPEAYLMWDIESDRQIASFPDNENAKIRVTLHECRVRVSKSRPTGADNDSVQRGWSNARISFMPKQFRSKRSNAGGKPGYGRGSRAAANARSA